MKIVIEINDPMDVADMNVCIEQLFKLTPGNRINIKGLTVLHDVRRQIYEQTINNLSLNDYKLNKKEGKI